MFIQISNIKLIYDTKDSKTAIGAEVEYKVVLKEGQLERTKTTIKGSIVEIKDIPDDEIKGKIVLMNSPELVDIADWALWDFNRLIHDNIMKSLIGGQ